MKRFNVRVYGLWLRDNHVLVGKEQIRGRELVKFPGGGLEFGEGTIDALKREWMEELNLPIEVSTHYYTTDFFQPSAFDDSQVISIYYLVQPLEAVIDLPYDNGTEHFYFLPVDVNLGNELHLPIDKVVARKLIRYL